MMSVRLGRWGVLLFALALAGGGVWRLSLSQRAAEMVTDSRAFDKADELTGALTAALRELL